MQYLCLSDLYLGSSKSRLTEASSELANALRKTVLTMNLQSAPKLILIGNTFELSTPKKKNGLRAFVDFLRHLYPQGAAEAFAREIYLLPGDQDRKLIDVLEWESLLNEESGDGDSLGETLNSLTHFVQTNTHLDDFALKLVHSNMVFVDDNNKRSIVIDHGYLMDPLHRLGSTAAGWYGDEKQVDGRRELEEINGPWIDFLNSTINREYKGEKIYSLHKLLSSPWKLRETTKRLQKKLSKLLLGWIPMGGATEVKAIAGQLSSVFLEATLARFIQDREKDSWSVLSVREQKDLKWYLKNIVNQHSYKEPKFVFGYTQKAFEDFLFTETTDESEKLCWEVYNAGGWLKRDESVDDSFGASAVFIDNDLNICALRFFNDSVAVRTCSGEASVLSEKLVSAVESESSAWSFFSERLRQ